MAMRTGNGNEFANPETAVMSGALRDSNTENLAIDRMDEDTYDHPVIPEIVFESVETDDKASSITDLFELLTSDEGMVASVYPLLLTNRNCHKIRKQPNRPHLVPSKPFMNYNFPPEGVQNQGIQFKMDLFKTLQKDMQMYAYQLRLLIGPEPSYLNHQPGAFDGDPQLNPENEALEQVQEVEADYDQEELAG
ncbi:hypothetical protein BDV12DRAFT_200178 [Aspergillus spectabilis]